MTWYSAGWLACCIVSIVAGAVFLRYYVLQRRETRHMLEACNMTHAAWMHEQAAHKATRQRLWAMVIKLRAKLKELANWNDDTMDTRVLDELRLTRVIRPETTKRKPPDDEVS